MTEMNLDGLKELARDAMRDVSDADRCLALHITPATGTLHRRLRETANAMNVLLSEVEQQRMMIASTIDSLQAENESLSGILSKIEGAELKWRRSCANDVRFRADVLAALREYRHPVPASTTGSTE